MCYQQFSDYCRPHLNQKIVLWTPLLLFMVTVTYLFTWESNIGKCLIYFCASDVPPANKEKNHNVTSHLSADH